MAHEAGWTQADRSRMTLLDPQPPALGDPARRTDAELIVAVRAGNRTAYAELYRRHEPSARRMAGQLCPSPHDADDLVAEAFARVLDQLQLGRGPDTAFRAYLLTAVRNGLYERARRDRRLELTDDMARHDAGVPWVDPVEAELDSALAVRAFASLPERWQTVLWYSEVEQESTAQVGSRLGLRPNAVAALAYRAREGLRQAYLQAHVAGRADESCRATVAQLGSWTRDRLSALETARVDSHLAGCRRCRALAAELADVNGGLRGSLAPLLLLAASGRLAAPASTTAVTAATAASAGGVTAAGAGSVGGSVLGSLTGWASGVHAGAAVLTVAVVGSTAVVAGVAVPHVLHRAPAAVAPAAPGTVAPSAGDRTEFASPPADPAATTVHPPKKAQQQATAKAPNRSAKAPKAAARPSADPQPAAKPSADPQQAPRAANNPEAAAKPQRPPQTTEVPSSPEAAVKGASAPTASQDLPDAATATQDTPDAASEKQQAAKSPTAARRQAATGRSG